MHRNNLAISGPTGSIQSILMDAPPWCNALMLIPTKLVCAKVGVTGLLVGGVANQRHHSYQCWPRLKCDLEHMVHVLIPGSQIQELRSNPLRHAGHPAHAFLPCKISKSILVFHDCALALMYGPLANIPVMSGECLDLGMSSGETDQPNDIEVVVKLLKSLLEPGNLSRLSCGICHLEHDVITLQAILLDVLIEVGHVDVVPHQIAEA